MLPAPDTATLLMAGLAKCARMLPFICGHERRFHAPCNAVVTPAKGKKAAEICGCPGFVEPAP